MWERLLAVLWQRNQMEHVCLFCQNPRQAGVGSGFEPGAIHTIDGREPCVISWMQKIEMERTDLQYEP